MISFTGSERAPTTLRPAFLFLHATFYEDESYYLYTYTILGNEWSVKSALRNGTAAH
jgi:hypothetical protein